MQKPEKVSIPTLVGLPLTDAIKLALKSGFSIRLLGNGATCPDANDIVMEQSIPPGMMEKRGSVITIRAIERNYED